MNHKWVKRTVQADGSILMYGKRLYPQRATIIPKQGERLLFGRYEFKPDLVFESDAPVDEQGYVSRMFWEVKNEHLY